MKTTKTNPAKLLLRYLWPRMQRGERHFIIDDTQLAFSMTAQQLSKVVRRFNETGTNSIGPVFVPRRCSTSTASRSQPPEKPTPCLKERCYEGSPLTHHGRNGHTRSNSMNIKIKRLHPDAKLPSAARSTLRGLTCTPPKSSMRRSSKSRPFAFRRASP